MSFNTHGLHVRFGRRLGDVGIQLADLHHQAFFFCDSLKLLHPLAVQQCDAAPGACADQCAFLVGIGVAFG